jgi:hypothetical protein
LGKRSFSLKKHGGKMKYLKIFSSALVLLLAFGCSSSKKSSQSLSPKDNLLEVLTDFSIALNANDFRKALNYLHENEKNDLTGSGSSVPKETQMQLKALRLQKLIKNPRIKLVNGKLTGIVVSLPKLEHIKQEGAGSGRTMEEETPEEPVEPGLGEGTETPEGTEAPEGTETPGGTEAPMEGESGQPTEATEDPGTVETPEPVEE